MSRAVVLVTSRSFSSGDLDLAGELTEAGCQIVTGPSDHDLELLRPLLASATAWVAGTGPVTADHLDAAPKLQIVARYGVGVEAVDLGAAAERGILVTNTPGANSGAVADHAVALILAALRDVAAGDRGVRAGRWAVRRTRQLGQLTVGIVGLGRIGREVVSRLSGFGSTLLGYDPWVPQAELDRLGIERVNLEELGRRSDVITLHAPGDAVLVDATWLGLTKSRGPGRRSGGGRCPAGPPAADLCDRRAGYRGGPPRQPAAGRRPGRPHFVHPARRGPNRRSG
jgi:D-3-phosphoglycerate dehydrogenase